MAGAELPRMVTKAELGLRGLRQAYSRLCDDTLVEGGVEVVLPQAHYPVGRERAIRRAMNRFI